MTVARLHPGFAFAAAMRSLIAGIGILLAGTFGVFQAGFVVNIALFMMDGGVAAIVILVRHGKIPLLISHTTIRKALRSASRQQCLPADA